MENTDGPSPPPVLDFRVCGASQLTRSCWPHPGPQSLLHPRLLSLRGVTMNGVVAGPNMHPDCCVCENQVPSFQVLPEVSRSRHRRKERQPLHSSMPSLVTEVGSTRPSTTSNPTKSPGSGKLGTTGVRARSVGEVGEGEAERFVGWGRGDVERYGY